MKNASFLFLCCILLMVIIISITTFNQIATEPIQMNSIYTINILNSKDKTVLKMPLEEYVWRVAAKEMPISFHDEAFKAQIVVARTYALRKICSNAHEDNIDVCTDHNHCTAFLLPGDEASQFSSNHKSSVERLQSLTLSTEELIITHDKQPILAVFHATSSGITEKSSDIWQAQLPYLINVESSVDEKAHGFNSQKSFSEKELKEIFGVKSPITFHNIILTDAGSVKSITIGDKKYSGTEIRNLLGLRSNNFTIQKNEDIYTFLVKGYGHGVGMSQTGANILAEQGYTYREILQKYYPGTEIKTLSDLSIPTK